MQRQGNGEKALTSSPILPHDYLSGVADTKLVLCPANSRDSAVARSIIIQPQLPYLSRHLSPQHCWPIDPTFDFSDQAESVLGRHLGSTNCEDGTSLE